MAQAVDFKSGVGYKEILIQFLHTFRDLITTPGSATSQTKQHIQFCEDLVNDALSTYEPKLLETGSMAEGIPTVAREPTYEGIGIHVPFFEPEIDLMTVVSVKQIFSNWSNLKMRALASDSCFVQLELHNARFPSRASYNANCGTSEYLAPCQFMDFIRERLEQTLDSERWTKMVSEWIWDDFEYKYSPKPKKDSMTISMTDHGPAIQLTVNKKSENAISSPDLKREIAANLVYSEYENRYLHSTDIDLVPALLLPCWPEQANEWITRQRRWPSQSIIDQIVSEGVMVVCKPPKNGNIETDWRLSFSNAEVKLFTMKDLPCRNFAHRIFKYTVKHLVHKPKVINSYHCKSITLWACERVPPSYWSWDNLAVCVLGLFDDLIGCIAARSCPHYFIRHCNLFEDIPHDFLDTVGKKLVEIRNNPLIKRPFIGQAEEKELVKYMQAKSLRYPEIRKLAELLLRLQFNKVV